MADHPEQASPFGTPTRKRLRTHTPDTNAMAQGGMGEGTSSDGGHVDHRKRRRNRTIQSCLNCHGAKRMCDRKRPSCGRCTQLGMSGSCLYEIDDPSQWTEREDENARLLKRIAELEGVIRELRSKPHPKPVNRFLKTENGNGINLGIPFEEWLQRYAQAMSPQQYDDDKPDERPGANVINPALLWDHPQAPGAASPPNQSSIASPLVPNIIPAEIYHSSTPAMAIPRAYDPQSAKDEQPPTLAFSPPSWESSLPSATCRETDSFMCIDPCLLKEEDEDTTPVLPAGLPCGCVDHAQGKEADNLVTLMTVLEKTTQILGRARCQCKSTSVSRDLRQRVQELHNFVKTVMEGPDVGENIPTVK